MAEAARTRKRSNVGIEDLPEDVNGFVEEVVSFLLSPAVAEQAHREGIKGTTGGRKEDQTIA